MDTILITFYLCVLYFVEAFHDFYVIKAGETDHSYNKKWHYADAVFHFLLWTLICLLTGQWIYLLIGGFVRLTVFQNILNVLRGKSFFYIGSEGMDGWLSKKLGKVAPYLIFSVSVIALIVINILYY